MKSTGFLNTLRTEIIDANNGNGKSVSTVKNYCDTVRSLLTVLEDNIVITSDSSKSATYNLFDIKLDIEDREIFKELILDLNERKIVVHAEDIIPSLRKTKHIMQTTRTINEMISGKGIVIANKEGFRKYVSQLKKIMVEIRKDEGVENKKERSGVVDELTVGSLTYRGDGAICFKGKIILIRPQMKTLCILFMKNHKKLLDYSTIKDELIVVKKRSSTSFITITKYVNEIHNLLEKLFRRKVIFNHEKEGYIFDITRKK